MRRLSSLPSRPPALSAEAEWVLTALRSELPRNARREDGEVERLALWLQQEESAEVFSYVLASIYATDVRRMMARFASRKCLSRHVIRRIAQDDDLGVADGLIRNAEVGEEEQRLLAERLMDRLHHALWQGGRLESARLFPLLRHFEEVEGALDPAELEVLAEEVLRGAVSRGGERSAWLIAGKELAHFRTLPEVSRAKLWTLLGDELGNVHKAFPDELGQAPILEIVQDPRVSVELLRSMAKRPEWEELIHLNLVANPRACQDREIRQSIWRGTCIPAVEVLCQQVEGEELREGFRLLAQRSPESAVSVLERLSSSSGVTALDLAPLLSSTAGEVRIRTIAQSGRFPATPEGDCVLPSEPLSRGTRG